MGCENINDVVTNYSFDVTVKRPRWKPCCFFARIGLKIDRILHSKIDSNILEICEKMEIAL